MNSTKYNVIGLTKNNEIVAVFENKICYFNAEDEKELLYAKDFSVANIVYIDKNFILVKKKCSIDKQVFDVYRLETAKQLKSLLIDAKYKIHKISNSGKYLVLNDNTMTYIFDTTKQSVVTSYNKAEVYFDSDDRYAVAFFKSTVLGNSHILYIYDLQMSQAYAEDFDFNITCQSKVDIKIAHFGGSTKIMLSAVFVDDKGPYNLLIYDFDKKKIISRTKVSPSISTPKPKQLVGIFDEIIVLCAMFGGMCPSYWLWMADKYTGEYLCDSSSVDGSSIQEVIESNNSNFMLLKCQSIYEKEKSNLQIYSLRDENFSRILGEEFFYTQNQS